MLNPWGQSKPLSTIIGTRFRSNAINIGGSGGVADITSINLPAGEWMISGMVGFVSGTTNFTRLSYGVSGTSATFPVSDDVTCVVNQQTGEVKYSFAFSAFNPGTDLDFALPIYRYIVRTPVTFYLVASAIVTVAAPTVYGTLQAWPVNVES